MTLYMNVSISFKNDVYCATSDFETFKEELVNKEGIYMFYTNNKELLYVGISNNLYYRIKSYFSYNIATATTNRNVKEYFQYEEGYIQIIFEKELWKREMAETYLIHAFSPRFNLAKVDPVTDGLNIYDVATDFIKEKQIAHFNHLYEHLRESFDEPHIDRHIFNKSFPYRVNAFVLGNDLVCKKFAYSYAVDNILKKKNKGCKEIILSECVSHIQLADKLRSSKPFRDTLESNGLKYIGNDLITLI